MLDSSPKPRRRARSQRSPIRSASGRSRFQRASISAASAPCSVRSRSSRSWSAWSDEGIELALRPGRESLEEGTAPPLEAEQRPDQQPPIDPARGVLVEDPPDVGRIEKLVNPRLRVAKQPVEVLDALATEPARVGRAEALLATMRRRRR